MTSGKLMTFSSSVASSPIKRSRRLSNHSIKSHQEGSSLDSSSTNSNSSHSKGISKKRKTRCCRILDKEEIIKYFSVKEEEAAQLLNVSKSKLKRIKKGKLVSLSQIWKVLTMNITEMGISRWPYRRLEALKQELQDITERIKTVNIQSINNSITCTPFFTPTTSIQTLPSLSTLQLEESILRGSIELIHHIPNIIVKHNNDHIKEIARKTQRISISNLLNL